MNDASAALPPLHQLLAGVFECLEPPAWSRKARGHRDSNYQAHGHPGHPHHDPRADRAACRMSSAAHDERRAPAGWAADWPADLGWLLGAGPHRGWPGRGPGWGGPGWAGPGGGGGRSGGPHHGRGPRRGRASRGDVRSAILMLLDEEARNGYQIIQDIAERSHGIWRPSPGSVYPALAQLEDEGLITAEREGSGRRYQLTDEGQAYVADHRAELNAPWEAMAGERERRAEREPRLAEFTELMGQTGFAAIQVLRAGGPQQIDDARRLLEETRRGLYRILAESDPAESEDDPEDEAGPDNGPDNGADDPEDGGRRDGT